MPKQATDTHGGPNRGQGRKPKPDKKYKSLLLKLPPPMMKWLKRNINPGKRNQFIREAIARAIDAQERKLK